jgi:hypothetical protein
MPATRAALERHYTEDTRDMGEACPECGGNGFYEGRYPNRLEQSEPCPYCEGTGTVSPERAAEDAADDYDDLLTELRADREAGR